MIEFLKVLAVPGGVLSILAAWVVSAWRRPTDAPKTSTEEVHRAEAEQIAKDTGLEDKWKAWAEHVEQDLGAQIQQLRGEVREVRSQLEETTQRNLVLTGYAWQLRADITIAGLTPRPWPFILDPDRPDRTTERTAQ